MDDFPAQPPEIRPVSLFTRYLAWMLDCALFGLAMIPVVLISTLPLEELLMDSDAGGRGLVALGLSLAGSAVRVLIQFPVYAYYYYISGQTPGKRLFRIRIVDYTTLEPLTAAQAVGRYLGTILSSCCCYCGYILAAFNADRRALHDFIGGTRVAYTEPVPWTTGGVVLTITVCALAAVGLIFFPFILLAAVQQALEGMENPLWSLRP